MNITPAMKQYYELKEKYKDAILFFRMGDFYEMFEDDAKIAHNILGISLTSRNKNSENPIALAGIPYHAKEKYLPILLEAGYKVAIAEQISDPKAKWIIEREVQRVVTPATAWLEGEEYNTKNHSNVLISIYKQRDIFGFSSIDINSQTWICSEFHDIHMLQNILYKMFPSEIVIEKSLSNLYELTEIFSKKYKTNIFYTQGVESAYSYLTKNFWTKNLESYGVENFSAAQNAAAMLHKYFVSHQMQDFRFLKDLKYESFSERMNLDESTIKSLDIVYNIATSSKTEGTLFGALNKTKTPMWKRLLHSELLHPLIKKDEIISRQDFIEYFTKNVVLLDKLREKLKYIWNIEMFLARLETGRINPWDLIHFKNHLIKIREIRELLKKHWDKKIYELISEI